MPRRPRPVSREKRNKGKFVANVASSSKVQLPPPKAASKRKLKAADSESESDDEEKSDDEESSSDEDSDDDGDGEGDSGDGSSGGDFDEDGEESDVDVDAPRVAQWVDDEDMEELEMPPRDGKAVNPEDIVRFMLTSQNLDYLSCV